VDAVWSHLKRSLANLTNLANLSQLAALIKTRLQYRPLLINGFLAKTGSTSLRNPHSQESLGQGGRDGSEGHCRDD
jgi:hypothetical protein